MKKSQALAALAFAFALGVIAPVASTVSAFEVVTDDQNGTATGTATCQELTNAINTIRSAANYRWVKERATIDAKYATKDYVDITGASTLMKNASNTETVKLTFASTDSVYAQELGKSVNAVAERVSAKAADGTSLGNNTIANTPALLNAVQGGYYNVFATLFEAIEDPAHANKEAALAGLATLPHEADAAAFSTNSGILDPNAFTSNFSSVNSTTIDAYYNDQPVTQYFYNIYTGVKSVSEKYDKAVAGKAAYEALLSQPNALTTAGATAYAAADKDTNPTVVEDLHDIAKAQADITVSAWWTNVYNTYEGKILCDASDTVARSTYFDSIWYLATEFKGATGQSKANTVDIAEYLINYVPTGDDDDTIIPGGDQNGNDTNNGGSANGSTDADNKDDKKTNTAKVGDLGSVATSAASASKSAGVMAGIATALTAAASGIVAFCNARRNGKKEA